MKTELGKLNETQIKTEMIKEYEEHVRWTHARQGACMILIAVAGIVAILGKLNTTSLVAAVVCSATSMAIAVFGLVTGRRFKRRMAEKYRSFE